MGSFLVQSGKGMTLKFAEKLCAMTMKNNAKFEVELTLWSNGLVVKALDSQSRGAVFKITGWLQG